MRAARIHRRSTHPVWVDAPRRLHEGVVGSVAALPRAQRLLYWRVRRFVIAPPNAGSNGRSSDRKPHADLVISALTIGGRLGSWEETEGWQVTRTDAQPHLGPRDLTLRLRIEISGLAADEAVDLAPKLLRQLRS